MPGRQTAAQRSAGRERQDVGDAGALQGIDVGAVVDRSRGMAVPAAVAWNENDVEAVQNPEQELVGCLAERRGDPAPRRVLETGHVIDAATAQNTQHCHSRLQVGVGVSWSNSNSSPVIRGRVGWGQAKARLSTISRSD